MSAYHVPWIHSVFSTPDEAKYYHLSFTEEERGSEKLKEYSNVAWFEAEAGFREKFSHLHLTLSVY